MTIIWNGASAPIEQVGGKGYNLLRLYNAAKESDYLFYVPKFFVIPIGESSYTTGNVAQMKNEAEVKEAFSKLKTPVIVRSSSILEDSINASFAGVFHSEPDVENYQELLEASNLVLDSQYSRFAQKITKEKKIEWREGMGIIVQEQVIASDFKGTFQIDDKSIVEGELFGKKYHYEGDFDERTYNDFNALEWIIKDLHNKFTEGHYAVMQLAVIQAKRKLQLDYPLQAELCYTLGSKPQLVQIRQLPKIEEQEVPAEFNVPPNVPALYSNHCNGIAGEVVLPAYVTLSPQIAKGLIKSFKQCIWEDDPKKEEFRNKSKLAHNRDFQSYLEWVNSGFDRIGFNVYDRADGLWKNGNELFQEYALVCDKLDDSIVGMNKLTTNKKAIITTRDYKQISHALTVSRELGIIGMIAEEDMLDLETFLHQIETGDLIHIKSDGKRGVAYLEKRREHNPYHK